MNVAVVGSVSSTTTCPAISWVKSVPPASLPARISDAAMLVSGISWYVRAGAEGSTGAACAAATSSGTRFCSPTVRVARLNG